MEKKFDYLTKETAYPIIARYMKTGGLASVFYKKEGLSESQFYTWRKRYMKDHPPVSTKDRASKSVETSPSFHPVQVSSPPSSARKEQNAQIELEYPNGVILRMEATLSDVRIASLIKLY